MKFFCFEDVYAAHNDADKRHWIFWEMGEDGLMQMARNSENETLLQVLDDAWDWACPEVEPAWRELEANLGLNIEDGTGMDDRMEIYEKAIWPEKEDK